jgi:hypothetical protein
MGNIIAKKTKPAPALLEEDVIHKIVDRYLANNMINNTVIPDAIERQIYTNILKLAVGLLKDTLEHSHIEILGHKVKFVLVPAPATDAEQPRVT